MPSGTTTAPGSLKVGSGKQFVPEVVDFAKNVGASPSVVVDAQGNPFVSYLGFEPNLTKGEIPEARPVTAPPLPNVLFANIQQGYWNVGAVAVQPVTAGVPKGDDALIDPNDLDAQKVPRPWPLDATSTAVDSSGGLHVVWSERGGLQYAADTGGNHQFSAAKVASGDVRGPSVAVDSKGSSWISFFRNDALQVANQAGGKWQLQTVDKVAPPQGDNPSASRSAITVTRSGAPAIAYTNGNSPMFATFDEKAGWTRRPIERNGGGFGISISSDQNGNLEAAYYTATGDVHVAAESGAKWSVSKLAEGSAQTGAGSIFGWSTGIATAQSGPTYVTWYDLNSGSVALAAGSGGSFKRISSPGTDSGNSPSIGVTKDGSKVYVAWYDSTNQNLQVGIYAETKGMAIAVVSPSPAGAAVAPPSQTCQPTILDLQAPSGASVNGFDKQCLAAAAGKPFSIHFKNGDTVPHNVVVQSAGPAANTTAKKILPDTTPVNPGASATYKIDALKPGQYFYYCFFHPTVMTGTLVVK